MIPRSDRIFFDNIDGSPPALVKPPPPTPVKANDGQGLQSPVAPPPAPAARLVGKRFTVTKDPRKNRVQVPATPWRPRIARKPTSTTTTREEREEQPSPLDRKVPTNIMPHKLGSKTEPIVVSSAPTSATLAPTGVEKEEEQGGDTCRQNVEAVPPAAPKVEQREDRWGLLRSDLANTKTTVYHEPAAHQQTLRGESGFSMQYNPSMAYSEPPLHSFAKRTEPCLAMDMNNDTNIYVNGLPKEMNDNMLYLLGSACGVVISHKAMMDRQTGFCKGFGFLMYASSDMAKKAIDWLNSHGFNSSFAKESLSARLRRMADTTSSNVYLSNLPLKFTVHQLEQLFNPHPIVSLKILYDVHGESKGVAFVRLHDRATAKLCIERLHGRVLPGTTLPLQVRFADSEAQKQLKHSVNQKHTLESLGILPFSDNLAANAIGGQKQQSRVEAGSVPPSNAFGGGWRIRTASELDANVARGLHARHVVRPSHPTRALAQPFIPGSTTSSMQAVCSPLLTPERVQGQNLPSRAGLGFEIPSEMLWSQIQPGQLDSMGWTSIPTPRVMYSGTEGNYPLDRPFASPIVADWEGWKGQVEDGAAYLPVPLVAPPGLGYSPALGYDESKEGEEKKNVGHIRRHTPGAPIRVRLPNHPSMSIEEGKRAVSDPTAILNAQARLRDTGGRSERIREAVSADNSINAVANTSTDNEEEEEDGVSIDIQVHAQP